LETVDIVFRPLKMAGMNQKACNLFGELKVFMASWRIWW